MKKTITAFLLFINLLNFAQDKVKWKEPITTERFTFGYFQKNETELYKISYDYGKLWIDTKFYLSVYNNFRLTKTVSFDDLKVNLNKAHVNNAFVLGEDLYILMTMAEGDLKGVAIQKISKDLKPVGGVTKLGVREASNVTIESNHTVRIGIVTKDKIDNDSYVVLSDDKSKACIYYTIPAQNDHPAQFGYFVLNMDGEKISNGFLNLPINSSKIIINKPVVSNSGEVFVHYSGYDTRFMKNDKIGDYFIAKAGEKKAIYKQLKSDNGFVKFTELKITNDNKLLVAASIGSDEEKNTVNTVATFLFETEDMEPIIKKEDQLTNDILKDFFLPKAFDKEKANAEKKGYSVAIEYLKPYIIQNFDDNSLLVGFEVNYIYTTTNSKGDIKYRRADKNLLLIKMDKNQNIIWKKNIRLDQLNEAAGNESGFFVHVSDNVIYVYFNDNLGNYDETSRKFTGYKGNPEDIKRTMFAYATVLCMAEIDFSDGSLISRQNICKSHEVSGNVYVNKVLKYNDNTLLFFAHGGKIERIGTISF